MAVKETSTPREFAFTAVFEPAAEGGYVVSFPGIRDLMTEGETLEEARRMAADCLRCYLEALEKEGAEFPQSESAELRPIVEKVSIQLKAG